MRSILLVLTLIALPILTNAQVTGKWITIDDETGDRKSVVEIYEQDGKVYGKIIKLYRKPGEDPDPLCKECDDDDPRYMKKIIGMVIMNDMEKDDDVWRDGTILKPDTGTVYDCKIWRDGDNLKVRGYVAFFYRTQTWLPYTD